MNYLERSDTKFLAEAGDQSQRLAAIERLTAVRRRTIWMGMLLAACFLLITILGASHQTLGALGGASGIGFSMLILWMIAMKTESDLRLLKLVGQLKQQKS
jgi:hypothetical protein